MIEVGGGYSSLLAMDVNERFLRNSLEFTCIEPYPRAFLRSGRPGLTELVEERVENLPCEVFERLGAGDILFIDSSHVCKTGSDVHHLFLQVLPRLRPGVRVHVHDVFLPVEYPEEWVLGENRSWNEQYLLQAMLTHSARYRVIFGSSHAAVQYPERVEAALGLPRGRVFGGGSFWFETRGRVQTPAARRSEDSAEMQALVNAPVRTMTATLHERFAQAQPFRHVSIDDFFTADFCRQLAASFPPFDEKLALNEDGQVGAKAVHEQIASLGGAWKRLDDLVQGEEFRGLISAITGIRDLQYDPHYFGGGTHENLHGQGLDAHIDFNVHPVTRQHRRLNLIVYLSQEWRAEWGGSIQLHRNPYLPAAEDEVVSITPAFNRAVIFETNEHSWHGFPRIRLPEDKRHLSRKSFALYFYTDTRPADERGSEHSTVYVDEQLSEDIQAGTVLDEERVQHVRRLLTSRDRHIRRLYREIEQLNTWLNERRMDLAQQRDDRAAPDDAEPARLRRRIVVLEQRIGEFERSTSWRVTAPLRAIKLLFRRT
jgi:hypothetical protein